MENLSVKKIRNQNKGTQTLKLHNECYLIGGKIEELDLHVDLILFNICKYMIRGLFNFSADKQR